MFSRLLLLSCLLFVNVPAQSAVTLVDNARLQALVEQGVPVIDIRRPEEWQQTGIVEGSHLLTFFDAQGRYDLQGWLSKLDRIARKNEPFVLICRTGNRTGTLSRFLDEKLGYAKVYDVAAGITGWIAQKQPVVLPPR